MLIAQLTDTHVLDPAAAEEPPWVHIVDCNDRLRQAVALLIEETVQPDVVLLTGDLVDTPADGSMAILAELLSPIEAPILAVPGNHDDRSYFRQAFDQPYTSDDHLGWAVDLGPLVMIGVDTLDPPLPGGRFDEQRRVWLEATLADAADKPVAIAMHHPPFLTGIDMMDAMGLIGLEDFADTISRYPNVTRIFSGHMHRPITSIVAGATASVGLATVHAVQLDLAPDADLGVADEPAGYQLHRFVGGSWVTHTRYLPAGS